MGNNLTSKYRPLIKDVDHKLMIVIIFIDQSSSKNINPAV